MKYKILFLFLTLVTALSGPGTAQTAFKLWGDHPATQKMKFTELSVWKADPSKNTGTAVIVCPGGSYCYLATKTEGRMVAQWLNDNGINAFVLRYRIGLWGNTHPAMIQDLQAAIRWVRQHAADYHIDPNKIGAMGFSAGGHLVGTASVYYDENFMEPLHVPSDCSLRPDFTAMIYPVVTMEDSLAHYKSQYNLLGEFPKRELVTKLSLEENVHAGMPPFFLVACKDDKTVKYRNSVNLDKAMKAKGLPCEFHLYEHGGHGFGANDEKAGNEARHWKESFLMWLKKIEKY